MSASPTPIQSSGVLTASRDFTPVHNGADVIDEDTRYWAPGLQSFDEGFLPERDLLNARTEDSATNSPMVAAAMRAQIHKTVGSNYRMSFTPDYVSAGMTAAQAVKLIDNVERVFDTDSQSDECWFDASGRMTFTEIIACGLHSYQMRGETVAVSEWLESARKKDQRPFATAASLINPDRVHTPPTMYDNANLKAGFRVTNKGYAYGMYVLNRHPGDFRYQNVIDDSYAYLTRNTPWQRKRWLHLYSQEAADQSRGRAQFIAGLRKHRAFDKLDDAMLSNAILQTLYAAVIESPDPDVAMQGLMAADTGKSQEARKAVVKAKAGYYGGANEIRMNRAKVAHMYPGDQFKFLQSNQSVGFYDPFQATIARQLAKLFDLSYEEFTGDFTKTNYSGARAGTNQSDTSREYLSARVPSPHARYLATLWLEENCALGRIPGVPGNTARQRLNWFLRNKHALAQFSFFGPGIKHIDPTKGTESAENEMRMRVMTRRTYCNTYTDSSWRKNIDQIAIEEAYAAERGIDLDAGIGIAEKAETAPITDTDEE